MGNIDPSMVTVALAKISIVPILAKLFTPRIRSYTGVVSFSPTHRTLGWNVATLEVENSGKVTSRCPTSVVWNVPLEVLQFCGAIFF